MMKLPMSQAASGLLRSLLTRAGVDRDRILLTDFRSTDWQSLTFTGEQHHIELRVTGPNAESVVKRLTGDLEESEFGIAGQIVADIIVVGEPALAADGSFSITIEALTVEE